MRARVALPLVLVMLTAGCVSDSAGSPTPTVTPVELSELPSETTEAPAATGATTPLPNRTVEFPDGPRERPERPETLTEDSVGEFVETHEYRFVYNKLWYNEHSDVDLACELVHVTERDGWFEAEVSCTGSSNTGGETSGTETATVVHADWFTQKYRYYVDENSLIRERGEPDG